MGCASRWTNFARTDSLAHLKALQFSGSDRRLVHREICTTSAPIRWCAANAAVHGMGMETVAEYVETPESAAPSELGVQSAGLRDRKAAALDRSQQPDLRC